MTATRTPTPEEVAQIVFDLLAAPGPRHVAAADMLTALAARVAEMANDRSYLICDANRLLAVRDRLVAERDRALAAARELRAALEEMTTTAKIGMRCAEETGFDFATHAHAAGIRDGVGVRANDVLARTAWVEPAEGDAK